MRVNVIGDCDAAKALRGYLHRSDYVVGPFMAQYTLHLEEEAGDRILFDSIDCELEDRILRRVRELTDIHIVVQTMGGVQSDQEIRIVMPVVFRDGAYHVMGQRAVELGCFRGLEEMRGAKKPWLRRLIG